MAHPDEREQLRLPERRAEILYVLGLNRQSRALLRPRVRRSVLDSRLEHLVFVDLVYGKIEVRPERVNADETAVQRYL
jgi:hypothetical protein